MLALGIDEGFRVSAVAPGGDDQQASDWILALAGGEDTRVAWHRARALCGARK